jgi:hypothetical protein
MTRGLRIAGWIVFLGGAIWFMTAGGIDGFRENPLWSWVAFSAAVTGIALTGAANIIDSVARLRRRRAADGHALARGAGDGETNNPPDGDV